MSGKTSDRGSTFSGQVRSAKQRASGIVRRLKSKKSNQKPVSNEPKTPSRWPQHTPHRKLAQFLVDSDLIDTRWYSTIVGRKFSQPCDVALRFVAHSTPVPSHPILVTPFAGSHAGLIRLLRAHSRGEGVLGNPVFSEDVYLKAHSDSISTIAETRTHWIHNARPEDLMPVEPDFDSWAGTVDDWRKENESVGKVIEVAKEWDQFRKATWDSEAEQELISSLKSNQRLHDDQPLVSIIMPAYNRENLIFRSIESALNQTYGEFELIVVDDGSSDATCEVVRQISNQDDRVVLYESEHVGAAAARNLGIEKARGRYIAFLDSDDTWNENFLEATLSHIYNVNSRGAYAAAKVVDKHGTYYLSGDIDLEVLQVENRLNMQIVVLERELAVEAGSFNPEVRRCIDYEFFLKVFELEKLSHVPIIGATWDNEREDNSRISRSEGPYWEAVVQQQQRIDWQSLKLAQGERVKGKVSIVVASRENWQDTVKTVHSIYRNTSVEDFEIVVVQHVTPGREAQLAAALGGLKNLKIVFEPKRRFVGFAKNLGFAAASGEFVCFVAPGLEVDKGWLQPLLSQLSNGQEVAGVQSIILCADRSVGNAGIGFSEGTGAPVSLFAGLSVEDTQQLGESYEVQAVDSTCLLMRADEFARMEGFYPGFSESLDGLDLSSRARAEGKSWKIANGSKARIRHEGLELHWDANHSVADSKLFASRNRNLPSPLKDATDFYERDGLSVAGWEDLGASEFGSLVTQAPVLLRKRTTVESGPFGGLPQLRWAIKMPVPAHSPVALDWGDYYFAQDLATALRELGQIATLDFRGAHRRPTSRLDDVSLLIRGLTSFEPLPGQSNLLWVISNPDKIADDELRSFDSVYAASTLWAEKKNAQLGLNIKPLLQAADPKRFNPQQANSEFSRTPVFVGSPRPDFPRQLVLDAADSGIPFTAYGRDWADLLPEGKAGSQYFPNDQLGALYASSSIVIGDHHHEMRDHGFVANRLFEAIMCGTPVITEGVNGPDLELFGSAVALARSPEEIRSLVGSNGEPLWTSREAVLEKSNEFLKQQSFRARAEVMLRDVYSQRGEL